MSDLKGSIIKTPWKCEELFNNTNCRVQMGVNPEGGEPWCPEELVVCCYLCSLNEKCCDRCPSLIVTVEALQE